MLSSAKNTISKVPANDSEALKSNLMGIFEKRNCRNFYLYLEKIDEKNPATWGEHDIMKVPMKTIFKAHSLSDNTIDFLGHAVALHRDDGYLDQPAIDTIRKMALYMDSLGKYGDSPFLYPIYGLGGLPESFSRLCAIHGGTYMLNTNVD
jgi:Rab GDP dissociation inhibitor